MEAGEGVSFTVFFLLSVVYIMFDFNYIFVIFFVGAFLLMFVSTVFLWNR